MPEIVSGVTMAIVAELTTALAKRSLRAGGLGLFKQDESSTNSGVACRRHRELT